MQEKPFIRLKNNLNEVDFDVEPEYRKEYIRAFSNVLDRMDKYFRENDLYNSANYDEMVDNILGEGYLKFSVATDLSKRNWAGVHIRHFDSKLRQIAMGANFMFKGTTTEGVLCHEFFHYLTLGPEVLKYTENDQKYEVNLPIRTAKMTIGGSRLNVTERKLEGLDSGSSLDGGFICEGLTELCKQQLYNQNECYHSYIPQTAMVKFLNNITSNNINMKDFLRGDLPGYVRKIGYGNFQEFVKYCENFQQKFEKNGFADYINDPDYIAAQDILIKSVLNNAVQNKVSVAEYSTLVTNIINYVPSNAQRYKDYILGFNKKFVESANLSEENKKYLNSILAHIVQEEYSNKDSLPLREVTKNLSVKQTNEGLCFVFKGLPYTFKKEGLLTSTFGYGNSIKVSPYNDHYIMTTENTKEGIKETFRIKINEDEKSFSIVNDTTKQSFRYNINALEKRIEREKQNTKEVLQNFEFFDLVKKILQQNQDSKFYGIKKIQTMDGKTYIIARSNQKSLVYEQQGDKFVRVDVVNKQSLPFAEVHNEIYTAPNKTGLRGFMKSGLNTAEDGFAITLSDGTKLARYFDENGKECFGQIAKLTEQDTERVVKINNTTLYDKTNGYINDLLGINNTRNY